MESVKISKTVAEDYPDCLRDESRMTGEAQVIAFPCDETELQACLAYAREHDLTVTTQGARTGITGGAVPRGGMVINLGEMNRVFGLRYDEELDTYLVRLQPGVILGDLVEMLSNKDFNTEGWSDASLQTLERLQDDEEYKLGPDPTEWSASLGGMVACNASGAKSYYYGATRKHVWSLRTVLGDGDVLKVARGQQQADGRSFRLQTENGAILEGQLPSYSPPKVKTAAGYHAEDNMEMIDLLIGSEGTLGLFSEVELRLVPVLPALWGIVAFFPDESSALNFVHVIRGDSGSQTEPPTGLKPVAIEYFGHRALNLLRAKILADPGFADIPDMPDTYHTGVYVEFQGRSEEDVSDAVMAMSEIMVSCGGDEEATWIAMDRKEWERLRVFRHAIPEAVNALIDERRRSEPNLTKLGTDMAVPDEALDEVVTLYRDTLEEEGLDYVIFGHISANHLHVNILPRSLAEYERGKEMYLAWADAVIGMGGTISAEHGIGKIKKDFLRKMYGEEGIAEMKAVKAVFDPQNRLNAGNLFD